MIASLQYQLSRLQWQKAVVVLSVRSASITATDTSFFSCFMITCCEFISFTQDIVFNIEKISQTGVIIAMDVSISLSDFSVWRKHWCNLKSEKVVTGGSSSWLLPERQDWHWPPQQESIWVLAEAELAARLLASSQLNSNGDNPGFA